MEVLLIDQTMAKILVLFSSFNLFCAFMRINFTSCAELQNANFAPVIYFVVR